MSLTNSQNPLYLTLGIVVKIKGIKCKKKDHKTVLTSKTIISGLSIFINSNTLILGLICH